MNRIHTLLIALLSMLVSGCAVPHEISNALYDRETDELLQNTAVEYIVHAAVDKDGKSHIDSLTAVRLKSKIQVLENHLKNLIGNQAIVRQPEEGLLIVFPSDRVFKSGRSELKEEALAPLKQLAEILADTPDIFTYLLVHTDNNGSEYMSLALSEQRAKVLRKTLKKNGLKNIYTEGKGSLVPVITNESEEGRKLNRRVEIAVVISPKMIRETRREVKREVRQSLRNNRKSNN